MTTAQTISLDFDDEMKNTRSLLERVPIDDTHRIYKPHEKSTPLGRLATHIAERYKAATGIKADIYVCSAANGASSS
jgi:hypothetical protein